jgi:hypothetical protein
LLTPQTQKNTFVLGNSSFKDKIVLFKDRFHAVFFVDYLEFVKTIKRVGNTGLVDFFFNIIPDKHRP